jgi:hypothetical protein
VAPPCAQRPSDDVALKERPILGERCVVAPRLRVEAITHRASVPTPRCETLRAPPPTPRCPTRSEAAHDRAPSQHRAPRGASRRQRAPAVRDGGGRARRIRPPSRMQMTLTSSTSLGSIDTPFVSSASTGSGGGVGQRAARRQRLQASIRLVLSQATVANDRCGRETLCGPQNWRARPTAAVDVEGSMITTTRRRCRRRARGRSQRRRFGPGPAGRGRTSASRRAGCCTTPGCRSRSLPVDIP